MSRCEYAACPDAAVIQDGAPGGEDQWWFCEQHYKEHRADLWGEQWPTIDDRGLRQALRDVFLHPHGTQGRYRRHLLAGETPCEPCRVAANNDRDDRKARRRRRAAA